MSPVAVDIENLGKRYTIDHQRTSGDGLRHVVEAAIHSPFSWLRTRLQTGLQHVEYWALREITLQIRHGDVVGIIGNNGAGKSTLLKILSRITVPTEGRIRINGRIASLLEVGTGFHQELTGRENIFLNGAILGMARAEIVRKFDEIVDFSGIEEFLDTPVKRYSSGMYVRLAFSIAAHLEPEILIVDEVLAVGDAAFQRKCLGKMGSFAQSGRTVLFVSHNAEAVRTLCKRGVWMKDGRLYKDGDVNEVVDDYLNSMSEGYSFASSNTGYGLAITGVVLKNEHGEETHQVCPGEDLIVEISFDAQKPLDRPYFILAIQGANGSCFTANMLLDGHNPQRLEGAGKLSCRFKSLPLLPQSFSVRMSVNAKNGQDKIMNYQDVAQFSVLGNLEEYGFRGEFLSRASNSTPVVIPYEWHLPDGSVASVSLEHPHSRNCQNI
jgi:lipopolysaccharide transport system ATP-binding protein